MFFGAFSNILGYGKGAVSAAPPPAINVETSGLLVYLDASDAASYPGSGSTWTDLQGSNDATINGPVYSATNGGYFDFDGINDTISMPDSADLRANIGNTRTLQTWARINSYVAGNGIWGKQYGFSGGFDGYSLALANLNVLRLQMNGGIVNGGYNSGNNAFTLGTWMFITAVVRFGGGAGSPSLLYKDDNSTPIVSAANAETSIPNIDAPFVFGIDLAGGTDYANVDIGALYVYDRALSTAEIANNFNATKTRFGL